MKLNDAKQAIKDGEFDQAVALLSAMVKEESGNYELFALRAMAYRKLHKFQLSIDDFDAALKIEPNNADLRSEKGVSLFHYKALDLALIEMNAAVELDPENPYRYSSRAYIKDALKDIDGAIADYQKTVEIDPDDAIALNNLGMLEEKKGNMSKAKKLFDHSDKLQDVDMGKITEEAVKNGGSSLSKNEAKKEVAVAQKHQESKPAETVETVESTWTIIKQVFTNKEVLKEFITYIKGFFSKQK
jgi:Tfp pilus assembly protein PilF